MTSIRRTPITIAVTLTKLTALTVAVVMGSTFLSSTPASAFSGIIQSGPVPVPINRLVLAHTPKILIIDITLKPHTCKIVVSNAAAGSVRPDPACTPGAIDTAVKQANIKTTICLSGYTTSVRPASSTTDRFKVTALAAYGMAYAPTIELDHLVPLELGGASTATNLWPEPNRSGASTFENPKDGIETSIKTAVCKGQITLAAAQNAIASNWVTAKATLGIK
jgi:hypothetical protein